MIAAMPTRAYIRPLFALWQEKWQGDSSPQLQPSPKLLKHVEHLGGSSPRKRLSCLTLWELFLFFYSKYDEIQHLDALCAVLRRQMNKYEKKELLSVLENLKEEAPRFLNAKGHEHLAKLTEDSGKTLLETAKKYGIPSLDSRFFEAAQNVHYVTRLKRLQPNEPNLKLLSEVQQREVYEKRLDANERLGHAVLRILIDKLHDSKQTPSELWRNTLLAIGGDPRVPPIVASYRDWWMPLDDRYRQQMIAWMSELDLDIFLQIFKAFAEKNNDMERMFREREIFYGVCSRKSSFSVHACFCQNER